MKPVGRCSRCRFNSSKATRHDGPPFSGRPRRFLARGLRSGCAPPPFDEPEAPGAPALEVETQAAVSCDFSKLPLCQGRTCFCPNGVSGLPASWLAGGREAITPAPFDRVASASHWVGYIVQGTDTCPLPAETRGGAWQVQRPFATASAVTELRRFCEYTWTPAEGIETPPAIEALPDIVADPVDPARNPIFRLEPDLEAAIPAGEPVPEAAWRPLEAAFLEQVDVSVWGGLTTLASRADAPVRVAIVDAAQAGGRGRLRPSVWQHDRARGHRRFDHRPPRLSRGRRRSAAGRLCRPDPERPGVAQRRPGHARAARAPAAR
jgi:hypothetical protein